MTDDASTARAVPYVCPFCGEEDLRPLASGDVPGLTRGGWHCRSCLRVFSLSFHGVHSAVASSPTSLSQ
jgi:ribosomal protein L37AE/L43A